MSYDVSMERRHKPRSGLALGGLGCGWFEIRQDGAFQNWNLFNNRPVGPGQSFTWEPHSILFFLIRCQVQGSAPRLFLLQIEESHSSAAIAKHEYHYIFPWLSGMDQIDYTASVPFARLRFHNPDMPVAVELKAWSPFIPRNAKDSALPVAFFDFTVQSTGDRPLDVSLLATLRNTVGYDVARKTWVNRVLDSEECRTVEMTCDHLDPAHASSGSLALASLHADSRYYLGWEHPHPYYERLLRERELPDLDDTAGRNKLDPVSHEPACLERCFSTIGRTVALAERGAEWRHTFALAWDFPNRYARVFGGRDHETAGYLEAGAAMDAVAGPANNEGHYYSNFFRSAAAVSAYATRHRTRLLAETQAFHDAFFASSLPGYALDQVNAQLNTFRTSSWFTRGGDFGILEGLGPTQSFAGLSTIDVSMYGGVATAALFPELERAVVRSHLRFQSDAGVIAHSINLNFRTCDPREGSGRRLDLPAQYAYLALRAASWFDDRAFLVEVWPSVVRAIEYVLRERDANGDGLPDMSGIMCSYDNFPMYGVAPYVATQWLAALTAAAEAARLLGDPAAATRYAEVLHRGAATLEDRTWNGAYYRLSSDDSGRAGADREGCLTDQIIGQWACRLAGLQPFLKPDRVASALRQILAMNFHAEQGLRNCQWPGDGFLHAVERDCWVDQANTCWTGVELAFASLLIYEGLVDEGLQIVRNVDDRYRRWGMYWDHQEFGGHYFRPMSAWAILHAALGFSQRNGVVTFDPKVPVRPCTLFFTTAESYGHYVVTGETATVRVLSGVFKARQLRLRVPGSPSGPWHVRAMGRVWAAVMRGGLLEAEFPSGLMAAAGEELQVVCGEG